MSKKYLETFFEEKNLPYVEWEIVGADGTPHFIDSDVVKEAILFSTSPEERRKIADIIRKIDFQNGDVNHFLHHLAKGLVANHGG